MILRMILPIISIYLQPMSNNEPTFLPMNDLCDQSLEALIQHYLSVKRRLPNNLAVRERLVELQDELFKRRNATDDSN